MGDFNPLSVERPYYVGQVARAVDEPDCYRPRPSGDLLAEASENLGGGGICGVHRRGFDAGASDLGFKRFGRVLSADPAMLYDTDSISEYIGLLRVLCREKDRHALLPGESADLLPQGRAALGI